MTEVWVTRAEPGAQATAERLRALGFEAVVAPLLETRILDQGSPDLTDVAALAFTSANGVRAFAALSPARNLPVFAVGAATARAAREAGFGAVDTSTGDSADLAAFIAVRDRRIAGLILHPTAREPAGDLVGDLRGRGFAAHRLEVYETAEVEPPLERLMAARFVLLHSPKAAGILGRLLCPDSASKLCALCLSRAVAAPLEGAPLRAILVAPAPDETSLLALLSDAARGR